MFQMATCSFMFAMQKLMQENKCFQNHVNPINFERDTIRVLQFY